MRKQIVTHDGDYFPKAMLDKWKKKMKKKEQNKGKVKKVR